MCFRELLEAFPDAKVILTVREPETWYESVKNSIYKFKNMYKKFPMNLFFWLVGYYDNFRMVDELSNRPTRGTKKGKY